MTLEQIKVFHTDSDEWVMKAHSLDLRERVVRACEEGTQTQKAIAERFEVSYWFVVKIWQQWRRTGDLRARKRGGRCVPAIRGPALQRLKRALGAHPDATLDELGEASGVRCSRVTVHNTLKRLGYRRKKNAARQ